MGQLDQAALTAEPDRFLARQGWDVLAERGAGGQTKVVPLTKQIVCPTGGDDPARTRHQNHGGRPLNAELGQEHISEAQTPTGCEAQLDLLR